MINDEKILNSVMQINAIFAEKELSLQEQRYIILDLLYSNILSHIK